MKTIVWDLDDVLNNLMESWLNDACRHEHPETQVAFSQLRSNPPLQELNLTADEYLQSLDRFRNSPAGRDLLPHPIILDWFQRCGHGFRHHVLTARPLSTVAVASAWVFQHFGAWIRHFHYVPSPRPGVSSPNHECSKLEVLQTIGQVDFFVDDATDNIRSANAAGIRALLFPQPWNSATEPIDRILESITSVNNPRTI